jgi:hypothetical protein
LAGFYAHGLLIGLLTLVGERDGPNVGTLRFAGSASNDLADVMALPGHEEPVARAAVAFMTHKKHEGWRVELTGVDPDGLLARGRDTRLLWEETCSAPFVELDHPSAGPPRSRRSRLARALGGLREEHDITFRCMRGAYVDEELEAFIAMRERRLLALSRTLDDPPLDFLRAAVARLAPTSRCAFLELLVDDEVVARDLHLLDDGVAMLWLRALDMRWLRPPCGLLLLGESMRWLRSEGFRRLDFGRGGERYKFEWGGCQRRLLSVSA